MWTILYILVLANERIDIVKNRRDSIFQKFA